MVLDLEDLEQSPAICTKRFLDIKINFINSVLFGKDTLTGTGRDTEGNPCVILLNEMYFR